MRNRILIILILFVALTSCTPTTYTTEFDFLPNHPNMEFVEVIEQNGESEYKSATYIVKGATQETVMDDYQKLLEKDKWEITFDNKPDLIEASKDEHVVNILAYQRDGSVTLAIIAK